MASMVVIADAPMLSMVVRQERVGCPSIARAGPALADAAAELVLVMRSTSRKTQSSGIAVNVHDFVLAVDFNMIAHWGSLMEPILAQQHLIGHQYGSR